jgi:hypothetical protein
LCVELLCVLAGGREVSHSFLATDFTNYHGFFPFGLFDDTAVFERASTEVKQKGKA